MLRQLLPQSVKLQLQLLKREAGDIYKGVHFAERSTTDDHFQHVIEMTQEVKRTSSYEAKKQNLSLAIHSIEQITIEPRTTFSFWKAVGNPSKNNGFAQSRSLHNGELKPSYGGGLCQLSGLIYYTCLQGKLEIIERYNHSADIYTEATRFAPLGSDATVVYGYKDLRVRNNYNFPIRFNFSFNDNFLTLKLCSPQKIEKATIDFVRKEQADNKVKVLTVIDGASIDESVYVKQPV